MKRIIEYCKITLLALMDISMCEPHQGKELTTYCKINKNLK